jgi:A/G-specific adenine glycosylase
LLTADDKVLLHKREKGGLLAGLIELPGADGHLTLPEALLQASLWGAAVGEAQALPAARHIFTHIEWDMIGYRMRCSHFEPPEGFLWASRAQLDEVYALPSAFKQYRRALQED